MLRSLPPNTGGREAHGSGEAATRPRVAGRRQPALRGHSRGGRTEHDPRAADGRGSLAELHRRRGGDRSLQRGAQRLLTVALLDVGRASGSSEKWHGRSGWTTRYETAPERNETRRLDPAIVLTCLYP